MAEVPWILCLRVWAVSSSLAFLHFEQPGAKKGSHLPVPCSLRNILPPRVGYMSDTCCFYLDLFGCWHFRVRSYFAGHFSKNAT